jgi:PAS domain S-box-containing protein
LALSNVIVFGFLLFGQVRTMLAAEQREKNIEAALRDMQRRERARAAELEALMDAVPAVVLVAHDADARRITGNRAAAEMLRMPKEANMSKGALHDSPAHYRLLKDGKELGIDELPVQIAARGATVRNFEHEVLFKGGERRALYGNATPLFDAHGAPRGALAAFIDVTDRRQTEEALRESEERLRRAQAVGRIGTWDYDLVSERLHGSDELYRLFGMAGNEKAIDVASAYAHVHPDDLAKIRAAIHRAITQKKPFAVEFRIRRPDGVERVALGQGEVIAWTPTGKPRRMVGTMVDITQRKQAEDLLAAEKERLAVTLNSIADGVIATDHHGRIVSINDVAKALLGVKSDDLTGRPVRDEFCLLDAEKRLRGGDIVTDAISNRRSVDIPTGVWLRTAAGARRPIAGKAAPIYRHEEVMGRCSSSATSPSSRSRRRSSCARRNSNRWVCWQAASRTTSTTFSPRSSATSSLRAWVSNRTRPRSSRWLRRKRHSVVRATSPSSCSPSPRAAPPSAKPRQSPSC